ncbi:protein of unknown function (plasmid) [Pseudorhizobium banfieldiae]|uniref:Uncharacterized protein n=1 Tax=Pseudorhizobium banfieldiae TaxID=1125847 RepID=L0NN67_9HYPH|nr:hypothetical protein [Pseudorhizobium banfieldiae]CAD6628520.1 hypothetical protein RNT25_04150 [arsenite-oxidising bacterium NT-25]CCF22359.1 protein of unknown function [Pseudorhizobium banfieldiae]
MLENYLTRPALARALSTIADTQPSLSDVLAPGGSAWLSHLVFRGTNLSISVSPDAVTLYSDIADAEHLGYAKSACDEAFQRLLLLHQAITNKLGVDSIRLDGRYVQRQPDLPGFIDIHRIVALREGQLRHELVYDEQIFVCDSSQQPRFLALLTSERLPIMSALMMEATQILISAAHEPGIFSGLIWVPLRTDMYRPSFFTTAPPLDRGSEELGAFQRRLAKLPERSMFSWRGSTGLAWLGGRDDN